MTSQTRRRAAVALVRASHESLTASPARADRLADHGVKQLEELLEDPPGSLLTMATLARDVIRWTSRATGVPAERLLGSLEASAEKSSGDLLDRIDQALDDAG